MYSLILDVETTTFQDGNPFSIPNKLCYIGTLKDGKDPHILNCLTRKNSLCDDPNLSVFTSINPSCIIIGFNIKFDLHWIRRYFKLPTFSNIRVWDLQLGEFILEHQRNPLPSLEDTCTKYKIPGKLLSIHENYWNKGIDTPDIPENEIINYLKQDLYIEYKIFLEQQKQFKENPQLFTLFKVQCYDLLALEEIEFNGQLINVELAKEKEIEIENKIHEIEKELNPENLPINFNSNDHKSAFLYGGTLEEVVSFPVGVYKTGLLKGKIKYKNFIKEHKLDAIFTPPSGSALEKEGYYSTNESVLRSIHTSKKKQKIIDLLLKRTELNKLLGTYIKGIPKLIQEMQWDGNKIHTNFSQCIARTGRLSSSKPNQQNFADEADELVSSRFK